MKRLNFSRFKNSQKQSAQSVLFWYSYSKEVNLDVYFYSEQKKSETVD